MRAQETCRELALSFLRISVGRPSTDTQGKALCNSLQICEQRPEIDCGIVKKPHWPTWTHRRDLNPELGGRGGSGRRIQFWGGSDRLSLHHLLPSQVHWQEAGLTQICQGSPHRWPSSTTHPVLVPFPCLFFSVTSATSR